MVGPVAEERRAGVDLVALAGQVGREERVVGEGRTGVGLVHTGQRGAAELTTRCQPRRTSIGQALQETVGQVVLPFFMMVTPKVLPLPLGLAVIT